MPETWWSRRNPNRCEYTDVQTGRGVSVPSGCCKCPAAFRLQLCGNACFDKSWKTEVALACCRGTHRNVRPNSYPADPLEEQWRQVNHSRPVQRYHELTSIV